jgi:WD40 repeat protein/tRNA A-37 threonylcarbamoyl transferase component Bud32
MNAERYQRVMRAFEEAIGVAPPERSGFLQQKLGDDPEAVAEVESLLAHHDEAASPVKTAAGLAALNDGGTKAGLDGVMPVLKGDYRIIRTIGEGGMGVVFEAEQAFPRRKVALKALRPALATRGMLRRFRNECELLARLQHPGIAQIYEAGVADEKSLDQAFFAMELVEGVPLTQYAREHEIDAPGRWRLMLKICEAVQHAHQRGVIHRDLKPANILVGADGQPKVVDFGVARASIADAHATMATGVGQIIGTLSYMSPEQMRGEDVDTRSDVYSLGVIAYELLTGALPFDLSKVPIAEATRRVNQDAPKPMSAHNRFFRGDAEIIVARAMAKEPDRRYSSAADLAEDIRRFLAHEPIAARRDSAIYSLRKLLSRHRLASSIALMLAVGVISFAVYAAVAAKTQQRLANEALAAVDEAKMARRFAESARESALEAKVAADEARALAVRELSYSTIERGRLESSTGNLSFAEDILWREYFATEKAGGDLTVARWALWEMYQQNPTYWMRRVTGWGSRGFASADGRIMVFATSTGDLSVIDTATGRETSRVSGLGGVGIGVGISPDNRRAVVALSNGWVQLVSLTGESDCVELETMRTKMWAARAAAWSPDGKWIAIGADRRIRLLDASTIQTVRVWTGHTGFVTALRFSPDSSLLASGSDPVGRGADARLWNVATGALQHDLANLHWARVHALNFSPDGRILYTSSLDTTANGYDLESRTFLPMPEVPISTSNLMVNPSPDGKQLLYIGGDRCYLYDVGTRRDLKPLARNRAGVSAAAFTPDGRLAIAAADGTMRLMGLAPFPSQSTIGGFTSWCFTSDYSPDGKLLAIGSGDGSIAICDAKTNERLKTIRVFKGEGRTRGVKFLSDSRTLVAASADGAARVYDAWTGELQALMPRGRFEAYALAVNPSEMLAVVGQADGSVRVWSLQSRSFVMDLPRFDKRIEGLAFSPDGKYLVISGSTSGITFWDVASQRVVWTVQTSAAPWATAFSPDGTMLYVTNQSGNIDIVDCTPLKHGSAPRLTATLHGHQRLAPALGVSSDGRFFASGGEEGVLRLWDARVQRPIASFDTGSTNTIVTVSFNSVLNKIAATTSNRMTYVYDLDLRDDIFNANVEFHRERLPDVVVAEEQDWFVGPRMEGR